ncbi:MAG: protein kinase [Gemmatimonadota bacterium]|nr:protein kinase [Gemmatimonadota bacterium]
MTSPTGQSDRLSAALAGRYRIERELGAGGMATVYLAFDEKHDRKVAIKVLKPELAAVLGAERFVVEIKTTAAMSHPHILPLFDSGTADGFLFYVMPYIQGETIRERLNRETQFGVEEAVRIAREIADALDYAHRHGVIHRDIKPENILLHDGNAMVMDFGIALAVSAAAGGRMTETGLSLGTPHYMSPEQATAEKEITARSDQYSLASVLYEMLAGDPPFTASAAQAVIMKIITEPAPSVTTRRKNVPNNVDAALGKALEKLPADRFESAKAFADALANPHFQGDGSALAGPIRSRAQSHAPWIAGIAVAALVGFSSAWYARGAGASAVSNGPVLRFDLPDPQASRLVTIDGSEFPLLPDGSGRVLIANGPQGRGIYVQSLAGGEPRFLPAPDAMVGARALADGSGVSYYTFLSNTLSRLRVAPMSGAPPRTWTDSVRLMTATDAEGWLYASHHADRGLVRVDPTGQRVEHLTELDSANGDVVHLGPALEPNGEIVAFQINGRETSTLAVLDLRTKAVKRLGAGNTPQFLSDKVLLFADDRGTLYAVRFDADRMEFAGSPVPVLEGMATSVFRSHDYELTKTGTLSYVRAADGPWAIVRAGSGGAQAVVRGERGRPIGFQVNSRGDQVLTTGPSGLEIHSTNGTVRRITAPRVVSPIGWLPDAAGLAYVGNDSATGPVVFTVRIDGSSPPALLRPGGAEGPRVVSASWSRTGVSYRYGNGEIWFAPNGGGPPARVATGTQHRMSPDGRYVAFRTNPGPSATQQRITVAAVPPGAGRWEVADGSNPEWSGDGRALYFATSVNAYETVPPTVMKVPILSGPTFAFGVAGVASSPPENALPLWAIDGNGAVYWATAAKARSAVILNWPRAVDSLMRAATPKRN